MLKVYIYQARNLSSLSQVSNLSRVRTYCSLFPQWHTTRKRMAQHQVGSNPVWNSVMAYPDVQLRHLLEEAALDISVCDTNEYIGRVRLGPHPSRIRNHQPWMDSTCLESAHWEETLTSPSQLVVRWHKIEESLEDREVSSLQKPPALTMPTFNFPPTFRNTSRSAATNEDEDGKVRKNKCF